MNNNKQKWFATPSFFNKGNEVVKSGTAILGLTLASTLFMQTPTFANHLTQALIVVAPLKKERPVIYTYIAVIVVLASTLYSLIGSRLAAKKAQQEDEAKLHENTEKDNPTNSFIVPSTAMTDASIATSDMDSTEQHFSSTHTVSESHSTGHMDHSGTCHDGSGCSCSSDSGSSCGSGE